MLRPLKTFRSIKHSATSSALDFDMSTPFTKVKDVLADATMLAHLIPNTSSSLIVDAYLTAVGAAFQLRVSDHFEPW